MHKQFRLSDFQSYRREFLALAEKALSEGRNLHAAYYFRSAEFFMRQADSAKIPTRQKFLSLVSEQFGIDEDNRFMVPYQDGNVKGLLPPGSSPGLSRPRIIVKSATCV